MLVSHAHSFGQQAKLAVTLAWIAGYTNIISVLACGTVTAHMSGITSTLGREVSSGTWEMAGFALFLIAAFFAGAALSGLCTELGRRRGWESIFVLPIFIEAALLAAFAVLLQYAAPFNGQMTPGIYVMIGLAAAAMGLQNATITQISSGQVRTTHMTGVLTDLGQESAVFFWRTITPRRAGLDINHPFQPSHPVNGRRLILLACLFGMFAIGAGLGTMAYAKLPRYAMFPPVLFLMWIIYQDVATPIAEIHSSALGGELPPSLAVFHVRKDHERRGRVHRTPNLLAWSERLTPETRVVILDLAEITELNANAILELKSLLDRFAASGRVLIFSGLTHDHMQRMTAVLGDHLPYDAVCPDLELAIARGVNCLGERPGERIDGPGQ